MNFVEDNAFQFQDHHNYFRVLPTQNQLKTSQPNTLLPPKSTEIIMVT